MDIIHVLSLLCSVPVPVSVGYYASEIKHLFKMEKIKKKVYKNCIRIVILNEFAVNVNQKCLVIH